MLDIHYNLLKGKEQKEITLHTYIDFLIEILLGMFEYKNLPIGVNKEQIELCFLLSGACVVPFSDKTNFMLAKQDGFLNKNYEFKKVFGTPLYKSDESKIFKGINGIDCIVGYNNRTHTSEFNVGRFASHFTQTEISMLANLKLARMNRIFKAKDSKEKYIIDSALNEADNGQFKSYIFENDLDELLNENPNGQSNYIELTDVKQIDKLQYLSNFYQDLLQRFFTPYGLNMNGFTKLAQQSTEEINDTACYSFVLPLNMLEMRKDFFKKYNKQFGENVEIDFSPIWKLQFSKLFKENEEPTEPNEEPKE